ncbi:uncharacterized protein EV154DRAFT_529369 [Mucor mucedo]|uniref:uncharacterized protein n=1 Tax=Mucor mucedo TaxID=29922 RepID=UPI002220DFC9|nr:uncharacterized protein EV154DRAFT_529369 [Mucor mucedo]KAI7871972.1 hypothetical protein EV154DRAFT_529369 [Mucor mucedo]
MSAFNFMNKTESHESLSSVLSSSLIEDLYDSQIDTFVNQAKPTPSRPQQKKKKKKGQESTIFSMIDDFAMASQDQRLSPSSGRRSTNFEVKSAFPFMSSSSSASSSTTTATTKTSFPVTSAPSGRKFQANEELKLISASSTLHRIQAEKNHRLQTLQRHYKRQEQTRDQIMTLRTRLLELEKERDEAISQEDFVRVERLEATRVKLTQSLNELDTGYLPRVDAVWREMHDIMVRESEAATHVLDCCEKVKEERHLQYMKFVTDHERMHQKRLEEIELGRQGLESQKSEVAFELGLWEQADEDLTERKGEATFQLDHQQKDLSKEVQLIQTEMDDLKLKLNRLQTKKATLEKSMTEIASVMHEKLLPFSQETLEHEQEYQQLQSKKSDISEKEHVLNEQETAIMEDMNKHQQDKDGGLNELQTLNEQMAEAMELAQQKDMMDSLLRFIQCIQTRDGTLAQHQREIQASRERVREVEKKVDAMQEELFGQQQKSIEVDESMRAWEHKITRWQRQKELAIESRRFQNAAVYKDQIQSAQHEIDRLRDCSKLIEKEDGQLEKQQANLERMKEAHEALVKEKNAEIKSVLKQTLEQISNCELPSWVDHEVELMEAHILQQEERVV